MTARGRPDGYVCRELGENLLALHRDEETRAWFARALPLLEQDSDIQGDAARLARLRTRAGARKP